MFTSPTAQLVFKLGYSHSVTLPLYSERLLSDGTQITPGRLDGRSKGTLLRITGSDRAVVGQCAARLTSFRFPDPYKGKGIHNLNVPSRPLKPGKRQN